MILVEAQANMSLDYGFGAGTGDGAAGLGGICTQRVSIGTDNEQRLYDREDKQEVWVILGGQHNSLLRVQLHR